MALLFRLNQAYIKKQKDIIRKIVLEDGFSGIGVGSLLGKEMFNRNGDVICLGENYVEVSFGDFNDANAKLLVNIYANSEPDSIFSRITHETEFFIDALCKYIPSNLKQ